MTRSIRIIRYIANVVDPNDWTALFTEVYVGALAMKITYPLTQKISMVDRAKVAYDEAVENAMLANALERGGQAPDNTWEVARGDLRWGR